MDAFACLRDGFESIRAFSVLDDSSDRTASMDGHGLRMMVGSVGGGGETVVAFYLYASHSRPQIPFLIIIALTFQFTILDMVRFDLLALWPMTHFCVMFDF